MKKLRKAYQALLGDHLTFRNTSREWIYIGYLFIVLIAVSAAYIVKGL